MKCKHIILVHTIYIDTCKFISFTHLVPVHTMYKHTRQLIWYLSGSSSWRCRCPFYTTANTRRNVGDYWWKPRGYIHRALKIHINQRRWKKGFIRAVFGRKEPTFFYSVTSWKQSMPCVIQHPFKTAGITTSSNTKARWGTSYTYFLGYRVSVLNAS